MEQLKSYCKFMLGAPGQQAAVSCRFSDKSCSVMENTADAILTVDFNGNITGWNSGAEQLYHFTADEVLGITLPVLPEDRKVEWQGILQKMHDGIAIPDMETQRKRRDGKIIDISASYFPLKDSSGVIKEFCAIHRDIRERKKLQKEMERAKELAMIGQLAAGIAHALNTPLASILLTAQMVKEDSETPAIKQELERIERQTTRCKEIVKNLLNLARPSGTYREPRDINQLIGEVIHGIEMVLKEQAIQIITDLQPELPLLDCNPQEIEEVLNNLLSNARDAISQSGTIKITTRMEEDELIIKVQDTGKGISADYLTHIFDPFFTTKEIGKGSGLGLALCDRIIRGHGGDITVESQLGLGTTFQIILPIRNDSILSAEAEPHQP